MTVPAVKLIALVSPTKAPHQEFAAVPSALGTRTLGALASPQVQPALSRPTLVAGRGVLSESGAAARNTQSLRASVRAFLQWTEKGWQDITFRDIDRYKAHLKSTPSKRGGQRKAATINLPLSALQSLFKWLCARDYLAKDPMLLIEKLKPDPIIPKDWLADEVKALFEATTQRGESEPRDRALLWVLLHGLRAREAEALNVGDFDGKRVRILEAKDDSVGQVPLLPEAAETIEVYLHFRRCWGEAVGPESPLFLSVSNNSKGDRLGYWGIYTVVKELAAIAGVKDAHPHWGRQRLGRN
jgi:integrase/recombinase XerD